MALSQRIEGAPGLARRLTGELRRRDWTGDDDNAGGLARLDVVELNRTLHQIVHRALDYEPPIDALRERLGSPD